MKRRALILGWHAWGYWTLVVALAAAVPKLWIALAVLAAAALFWLVGVALAVVRRDGTVIARFAGLVALALAVPPALPLEGSKVCPFWEPWSDRRMFGLQILVGLAGLLLCALLHAGFMRLRRSRTSGAPGQWLWSSVGFPLVVLAVLLLLGSGMWAPVIMLASAAVWLSGLIWAAAEKRRLAPRLLGLAVTVGLLAVWPPVSIDANRDAIAEAVFLHQLHGRDGNGLFLSVDGHDPSDDLMRCVSAVAPRIRRESEAQRGPDGYVVGAEAGRHGAILRIRLKSTKRSWMSPGTLRVEGGYYSGPLDAAGYTYRVAWFFGRWVVVGEEMNWVS